MKMVSSMKNNHQNGHSNHLRTGRFHHKNATSLSSSSSFFSSSSGRCSLTNRLLGHILTGLCCFYAGLLVGMSSKPSSSSSSSSSNESNVRGLVQHRPLNCPKCPTAEELHPVVKCDELESILEKHRPAAAAAALAASGQRRTSMDSSFYTNFVKNSSSPAFFPPTLSNMVTDYATMDRMEFLQHLEIGIPIDETKPGAEDVLLLYSSPNALPNIPDGSSTTNPMNMLSMNPKQALENCQTLKVILTQPYSRGKPRQCMAIVPQWESFNIYKYMRVDMRKTNKRNAGGINDGYPLTFVSRSHNDKNMAQQVPSYGLETEPSFGPLMEYLQELPNAHSEMAQLLANAKNIGAATPLIVQVCNKGQSELFVNFICSARSRGLDVSHVFLFATDEYTFKLCQNLGLELCYYNAKIFQDMPENAAHHYADQTFGKMMMAKVYCVHLLLTLPQPHQHSVLFQDVDLVWYQNPLEYFQTNDLEWDLVFQDDGARTPRYAPYSPNTGFYYVRHNERSVFLFNRLLKMGDTVARYRSHQAALTAAINENVSWIGLKVKVWRWGDDNLFMGGVEFHRRKELMKAFLTSVKESHDSDEPLPVQFTTPGTGKVIQPYIFHMSWTSNKDNKKLFFQQIGEWRVPDKGGSACSSGGKDCCLAKPKIVCHYRDKPSIIPCRDSPPIDNGKPSFW